MHDYKFWIPEFNLRNGNLASLPAVAAGEIANTRLGEGYHKDSVRYLSQLLHNLTQGENPEQNFIDKQFVFSYAISGREEAEEYWKGKEWSTSVLARQINLVAKDLRDFESLSEETQMGLENFCVNLGKECMRFSREFFRLVE